MTKLIMVQELSTAASIGTAGKWYKSNADCLILNNTGQTDVRVDKLMVQASPFGNLAAQAVAGVIVHISDENGNSLSASIVDGTTTDATLTSLLNQWKDNVFMTDFRGVGQGTAGQASIPVIPLEANTRRILKPGQKLSITTLCRPGAAETSKSQSTMLDIMLWYSAAAQ